MQPPSGPESDHWSTRAIPVSLAVAEVKRIVKSSIELQDITIRGEVTQIKLDATRGHWYFTIGDAHAKMSCFMPAWRARNALIAPQAGEVVLLKGSFDVWEGRGSLSFNVEEINYDEALGRLERERRQLEAELRRSGLVDRPRMPLPQIPKHVAVITSRTSDARADIQRIAHDRFPGLRMTIIHAIVQGGQAAASISRAISRACDLAEGQGLEEGEPPVDVIIVGRGGGSATDLWAFNLEPVAWAIISASEIVPVVSAVGHEQDHLVSDIIADHRAATPTHAAEMVVPIREECELLVGSAVREIERRVHGVIKQADVRTQNAAIRLRAGARASIRAARVQLEHRGKEVEQGVRRVIEQTRSGQALLVQRLHSAASRRLEKSGTRLAQASRHLDIAVDRRMTHHRTTIERTRALLAAYDPDRVLGRGYARIHATDGEALSTVHEVHDAGRVRIIMQDGSAEADVRPDEEVQE